MASNLEFYHIKVEYSTSKKKFFGIKLIIHDFQLK